AAGDEEIERAARLAHAHEFILELEDWRGRRGYDAHVGERGVKLSGGQRQRIAIARVILKDAPILVFDEATSALDSEVEAAIQSSLGTLMAGKTVIAIAHRLSTIARMDRLVVLDQGRIVEQGSHRDLLAQNGHYAALWRRQAGGFIDAPAMQAAELAQPLFIAGAKRIDFAPTELSRSVRAAIEKICARFGDVYWLKRDRDGNFPEEFYRALADDGWLGVCIPQAYGGSGLGVSEAAVM